MTEQADAASTSPAACGCYAGAALDGERHKRHKNRSQGRVAAESGDRERNDLSESNRSIDPGGHPGRYNRQDAYNDMLVTNGTNHGIGTGERRNHAGGVSNIERKPRTADYDV